VRGFPTGGGAVLRGAGQPADLQQGISVALDRRARIGYPLGNRTGCGESLDQRTERATVLGLQEALKPQPPITALPPPQLPRSSGAFGLGGGRGPS
jgi:hypothetical protein